MGKSNPFKDRFIEGFGKKKQTRKRVLTIRPEYGTPGEKLKPNQKIKRLNDDEM